MKVIKIIMNKILPPIFTTAVAISSSFTMASTPDYIQECMDCHGKNGISENSDVPSIAGFSAIYIEETFAAYHYDMRNAVKSKYRYGDTSREPTDMKKIADKLNEEQILKAAEFFSALPFVAAKQDFKAELVKVGKKIHDEECEKCHENGGSSPEEDAAILAGQWTPYLRNAVKHIQNESRDVDFNMSKKVEELTDNEWEALLNYYASQQ
ncbi:MAG: cytochrome c-553 [Gammaproteobacteria bacterium]|nr:cytochrome c-553 [Gammaproteobacteria bacterium]